MAIVTGTNGDDKYPNEVKGTEAADQLFGLAGNDDLIGFGGDDVLEGGAGADELFGSNGFDLASYKGSAAGVTVLLGRFYANGGDAAGDHLYSIEGVAGSAFSDTIYGDDGRNVLRGEGSGDFLRGEGGDDLLAGGDGGDRFVYGRTADSLPTAPDRILDFSRAQADRIDLLGIDANEQVTGDQAFQFVGQGPFTGAGQLRAYQLNGDTVIEANTTDTTAGAEMTIVLDPLVSMQATDFVL